MKRLEGMINENHGGRIICGIFKYYLIILFYIFIIGGTCDVKNRYVSPTIVDNPKLDSKMMQEEIFGPILPVLEFTDFDYVIEKLDNKKS